jgi:hypothetical protein
MAHLTRHSPVNVADSATRRRERTRGIDDRTRDSDVRTQDFDERTQTSTNEPGGRQVFADKGVFARFRSPMRGAVAKKAETADRTRPRPAAALHSTPK